MTIAGGQNRGPEADITDEQQALIALQSTVEFQDLRKRLRQFVFPMTALFLSWYLLFVFLGTYASDFMATRLLGNINIGLVLGLAQFLTTFLITGIYVRFASRVLDPRARALRIQAEGHTR